MTKSLSSRNFIVMNFSLKFTRFLVVIEFIFLFVNWLYTFSLNGDKSRIKIDM